MPSEYATDDVDEEQGLMRDLMDSDTGASSAILLRQWMAGVDDLNYISLLFLRRRGRQRMHANGEAVEEEDSRMQFPNSNASIFIVGGGSETACALVCYPSGGGGQWMHQDSRATLKYIEPRYGDGLQSSVVFMGNTTCVLCCYYSGREWRHAPSVLRYPLEKCIYRKVQLTMNAELAKTAIHSWT